MFQRRLGSRRSLKRLVPVFPNRFKSAPAKDCGDFGRGTFVADFELSGGELVFAVLIFRRNDPTAHSAMQMFAALPCITAGLRMTASAHHRNTD